MGCLYVYCLLIVVCRLSFVVFAAFAAFGVLVVCCSLFAVRCYACVGCCLLFVVCCLLFAVG